MKLAFPGNIDEFESAIEILLREANVGIRYRIINEIRNTFDVTEQLLLKRELENSKKQKKFLVIWQVIKSITVQPYMLPKILSIC